jgi:hypothetical protein
MKRTPFVRLRMFTTLLLVAVVAGTAVADEGKGELRKKRKASASLSAESTQRRIDERRGTHWIIRCLEVVVDTDVCCLRRGPARV